MTGESHRAGLPLFGGDRPPHRSSAWVLVTLVLCLALAAPGCARSGSTPAATAEPPVVVAPPPEAAGPSPAARALEEAFRAMGEGRLEEAGEGFEAILARGEGAGGRPAALYGLGLLLARPDHPGRDRERAGRLLREFLQTEPPPPDGTAARLVLGLLEAEALQVARIAELRGRVAAAGAESEDLRVTLAQREAELRRIKEILLGRSGGL